MDNEPFIQQVLHCPVTAISCLALIGIWFPLWNNRVPVDKVAFSYRRVVQHKEYWRILTAAHSHFDLFHLVFNVMSLWSCRYGEILLGSWVFFVESITLAIASKLVMLLVIYVLHTNFQLRGVQEQLTVGYSAVIFAWMTILAAQSNMTTSIFGFVDVPGEAAPFVSLILTQMIVRNASFIGHASGIVVGGMALLGILDWLREPYWAACLFFWVVVIMTASLKATTQLPLPCIDYVTWESEEKNDGDGLDRNSLLAIPVANEEGGNGATLV